MKISAVILDFGGTLVDGGIDYDEYHQALLKYLNGLGYGVKLKEVHSSFRVALGKLNRVRAQGKEQTFEEVYSLFLRRLSIPADLETLKDLHDIFKHYYVSNFFDCTDDVLRRLSERYKVALLSNTMSDQPHEMLKKANYAQYFDLMVCSRDLGIRKPNPKIFNYMLKSLGVSATETVHVGDSVEADMEGASEVGITGVWIRVHGETFWHGYTVNSICELPNLLKKISES
ncbi:MAG: HAD family hydrolase [Promethearchaeota archaeon]|jgi:HAD superfamily hydrolase (TIGR01549 family)